MFENNLIFHTKIPSSVLVVANQACAKTLRSSRILQTRLPEKFLLLVTSLIIQILEYRSIFARNNKTYQKKEPLTKVKSFLITFLNLNLVCKLVLIENC